MAPWTCPPWPPVPPAGPASAGLAGAAAGDPAGERWLTVTASLAADTSWATAGHEIAFAQARLDQHQPDHTVTAPPPRDPQRPLATGPLSPPPPVGQAPASAPRRGSLAVGCAVFDASTGNLSRLGPFGVSAARLDFWRAPTDNDALTIASAWRRVGLHRLQQRIIDVQPGPGVLRTRLRIAPAGTDAGFLASLSWTEQAVSTRLDIHVAPDGSWAGPLPKIGLRLVLDAEIAEVTWFGRGPGEAYRDTYQATRVGWFTAAIQDLATPYVRPQENGNRMDVRRLTLTGSPGEGHAQTLTVTGDPVFDFAVRPWSPELLTATRHTPDLVPDGRTYVHLDTVHHGIGSGSCGPQVQPQHTLTAHTVAYALTFSPGTS